MIRTTHSTSGKESTGGGESQTRVIEDLQPAFGYPVSLVDTQQTSRVAVHPDQYHGIITVVNLLKTDVRSDRRPEAPPPPPHILLSTCGSRVQRRARPVEKKRGGFDVMSDKKGQ